MTKTMDQESAECKEFLRYLKFCTHAAGFESVSVLPDDVVSQGRAIIEPDEALFLGYKNDPNFNIANIWITDRAIYLVSQNGATRVAYKDIDNVSLPFDDPDKAITNSELRKLKLSTREQGILEVPLSGITDGDLDLFKLSFIISKAQEALGIIPE